MTTQHSSSEWEKVTLQNCCFRPEYGYTASASEKPIGPKFLRITDIQNGRVNWTKVPYVARPEEGGRGYFLEAGDIVIARIGATTGKAYLIQECPEAVFASYLIRVRTKPGLSPTFLNYCLQTSEYWQHIDSQKGGRLKGGVNIPILENLGIPLPAPMEQAAVVRALDAVQKSKEARLRELTLERERKAALMKYLFTYGTRGEPTKQSEIGEIPQCWKTVQLGEIAKIGNGSTPKRSDERYWKGGTTPWITSTQIHDVVIEQANEFVTETARKECHLPLVPKNSIVVAITGQGKTLGNAAILAIDTCINQHLAYIQFERPSVQAEFVLVYLQSRYNYFRGVSSAGGSTKGALTCGFLKSMSVPVPSIDEQSAISGLLLACEKKCRCLEREVAVLEELFRAILEELMSGRLSALPLIEEQQSQ
jgi:type I restriction enzyme S subunit